MRKAEPPSRHDKIIVYIKSELKRAKIEDEAIVKHGYTICMGEWATVKIFGKLFSANAVRPVEFDFELNKMLFHIAREYERRMIDEFSRSRSSSKE